jgi:hypothetical protein
VVTGGLSQGAIVSVLSRNDDPGYKSGAAAWELDATLNWLKTYVSP